MKPQMNQQQKQERDFFTDSYASIKQRQKLRNHGDLPFTKEEFIRWFWKKSNSGFLFDNWVKNNCCKDLKPSVDRINDDQGYYFNNMKLTTFRDNHHKQSLKKSIAVQQINTQGEIIAIYQSMRQAAKTLGLSRSAIPRAIKTHTKANGSYWERLNNG